MRGAHRSAVAVLLGGLAAACTPGSPDSPPLGPDPDPSTSTVQMTVASRRLPDSVGGAASVVRHSGNGRIYASTNAGYLLELDPGTLALLRTTRLGSGRAHQLTSDGTHLYVHLDANGHEVLKIDPASLAVIAVSPSLGGAGSPEGFVVLGGSLFAAVGGPPGKIVKLDRATMARLGEWPLPNGIENHGLTTDGSNLFVLGVPTRGTTPARYFKVSPSLALLGSITFSWNGNLGGNLYFPGNGSIYTSPGRVTRVSPGSFGVSGASAFQTTSSRPLHWLAADSKWIYALDWVSPGPIRVFDPQTLAIVHTQATNTDKLHFGIVQGGYLWTASEQVPGVIGRYSLYGAAVNGGGGSTTIDVAAEADLYLDAANPGTNFGPATALAVGGAPGRRDAYLRFNVSGLPSTATVTDARLVLWATNSSAAVGGGGTLRRFAPTTIQWSETLATWNNPIAGSDASPDLATVGPVSAGSSYTWGGLAGVVNGNGRFTFVLRSAAQDGAAYHSREGTAGRRPVLRVTYTP
ncbi:MAG TPA: DNRLRE domain-containing protein [Gemmatimonadales bacterium]|nr:DNRLRE domain-containing protein [Gemmatimonadales bacterium]